MAYDLLSTELLQDLMNMTHQSFDEDFNRVLFDVDTSRRCNTMYIGFLTVQAQEKGFTGNEPLALAATVGTRCEIKSDTDEHGNNNRLVHRRTENKPRYYGHRDTDRLFLKLHEFDLVVGHNLVGYAYPIIEKYEEIELPADLPTFDLFAAIEDELGIRGQTLQPCPINWHSQDRKWSDCCQPMAEQRV